MNTKLGQPHFQIFFKPNIFLLEKCTQSILLVQIEITPWTKAFEPWSHPKSRGTIRFPKPSSVNSPKDPQGTGTFPKCSAGPHGTLKNCKHEHCENWSLDVVQSVTSHLCFSWGIFGLERCVHNLWAVEVQLQYLQLTTHQNLQRQTRQAWCVASSCNQVSQKETHRHWNMQMWNVPPRILDLGTSCVRFEPCNSYLDQVRFDDLQPHSW